MVSIFRGEQPNPIQDFPIPGSGDNNFRSMVVIEPFVDPPNSFRARTIGDMYFITPEREGLSTLEFDVGLDPKIEPIVFSIQNRCLNTTLRVRLTIPSFLRSNLGSEFLVPTIGDTTTSPIVFFNRDAKIGPAIGEEEGDTFTVPDSVQLPVGSGKGLINVTLTFSEAQAKTLNPNTYPSKIIFDIFPNEELTGPVFVSTTIGKPKDLNGIDEEIPIDDDEPVVGEPTEPQLLVITQSIEVDKLIPILAPGFIPGADGVTNDGVTFSAGDGPVEGPPPTGWTTEADGRAYPPIIPDPVCDPISGAGPDGTRLEDIPEDQLTPLQKLLLASKSIPRSFGSATVRRGFVIEPQIFLEGNGAAGAIRVTPELIVADSIPGRTDFKIIATSDKLRNGVPVLGDKHFAEFKRELEIITASVKEGERIGIILAGGIQRARFIISKTLLDIINEGERFKVKGSLTGLPNLQLPRIIATGASILFQLKNEGAGNPVE